MLKRAGGPFPPMPGIQHEGQRGAMMDYWEKKALEAEAEAERKRIRTDQDLVSLTELVKRWRGATEQEILTEERTGRLVAFYREKTVLNPDTLEESIGYTSGRFLLV